MPEIPNSTAQHPTFSGRFCQRRSRSLVSLTPLIDVVFILLLFFMLASSFLEFNTIVLDAPVDSGSSSSLSGALLIEVRLDGVRFAGRYMPLEQVATLVEKRLEKNPQQRILVQPGAGVNLQRTVRVLDKLARVGATRMSLMQSPGSKPLLSGDRR